jgi:hypothetical protein
MWRRASALRSARLPVNLIGSPINYADRLIGCPITSQSTAQGGVRGFIRSWVELPDVGVLLYNIGGNRWCGNVERAHKSNGARRRA